MTLKEIIKERYDFYSTTYNIYHPLFLKACEDYAEAFHKWTMSEGEDNELLNRCNVLYDKRERYDELCNALEEAMEELEIVLNRDDTISYLLEEIAKKCDEN